MEIVPRGTKPAFGPEWARSQIGTPPIIAHFRQNSALKIQKFSTDKRNFDLRITRGRSTPRKPLSLHGFDNFLSPRSTRGFPQLGRVLHSASAYPQIPLPFTLKCHGQDSRHRQPKGRSWQNHHRHQSGRLPRTRGPQGPPGGLRSAGELLLRPRISSATTTAIPSMTC